jgi:hypothetical protein
VIKTVVFDLDGTLANTTAIHAWRRTPWDLPSPRVSGHKADRWAVPLTAYGQKLLAIDKSIRQRDRYQRLADQYPAVFDQVWALACNERDWTAEPADVLADACHWVEQGQPINKAVHRAFSQGLLLHGTETLLFKRRR